MSISDDDIKQIEQYLDGAMAQEEKRQFEQRMSLSDELAKEVALHQAAISSLKDHQQLKQDLWRMYEQVKQERPEKKRIGLRPAALWFAAASVLFVMAVIVFNYTTKALAPEELYAAYFEPMDIGGETRGDNNTATEAEAVVLYKKKDYKAAASAFEAMQAQNLLDNKWRLCLASCYLVLGDMPKARNLLDLVASQGGAFDKQHAQWYLALAALKEDNKLKASTLLRAVQSGGGMYQKQAEKLLLDLE